jgi:aminoglycoside phosphotransferase (APT) family kinase protein
LVIVARVAAEVPAYEALQRFLDVVAPERGATVRAVTPLGGGYSRDTAIGDVVWGDGNSQRLVLRSDPPADRGVFVSDRDEEWRVLTALAASGPARIPAPLWYDETGEYFGSRCIVSDFYDGRSLQQIAREADDLTEARNTFVDTVVDVHRTPIEDLPAAFDRPPDWGTYIDGVLDLIDGSSRRARDSDPALRYAAARLRSYRPPPVPLVLVHGDCQPGNVLLGSTGPVVIDWEFARVGDPREDIGYYAHMPIPPNLFVTDPAAFLDRYRARTGMTEEQLNPEVVEYFYLLGIVRLFEQEMAAADAVADGRPRGVLATYLVNTISGQCRTFFETCRRLPVPSSTGQP